MRARSSILALLAVAWIAACGVKRPPAVSGTPGAPLSGPGAGTGSTAPEASQPIDAGPDVQPLRDDGATGGELSGQPPGEQGPLADVFFEFDRAALSEEAVATLKRHAQWLTQHADVKATIEGHCDQRGTVEYNLALGDQRAQAVREYLLSLGVAPDRLLAISLGKERPVDPEMTEAAWAKNRRAHFVVAR